MISYNCGHTKYYCPQQVINSNKMCYDCKHELIGKEIEFIRFGDIPASGRSINYTESTWESGVSVYLAKDGNAIETIRAEFADRPKYTGYAIVVDTGSDDEFLIDADTIRNLTTTN